MNTSYNLSYSSFIHCPEGLHPARVAAEHRGAYTLWIPRDGRPPDAAEARLARRLRRSNGELWPSVGDWVWLRADTHPLVIEGVAPRRSLFSRAAHVGGTQPIAANVDLVFAVVGLDGDFNLRRLDRALAFIVGSGARAAVIVNKVDLRPSWECARDEVLRRFPGVPGFATQVASAVGVASLLEALAPGENAALVGSSGAENPPCSTRLRGSRWR